MALLSPSDDSPVINVTDETFEADVLVRSEQVPVVVDLWAEWCGPCKTLGPILERVVAATNGRVVLAKIDTDSNPRASASFRVQSIPAVYAVRNRQVVDHFIGAVPEQMVQAFVDRLSPPESEVDRLVAEGSEASLRRAVELEPANAKAVVALAEHLVAKGDGATNEEALALLARLPDTSEVRRVAALARVGTAAHLDDGVEAKLDAFLERVKTDEAARQEFLDLLEVMGADDPRTAPYRKALTARLF